MGHSSRARLAETCGTRDESPSSNLGRGKQGESNPSRLHEPTDRRQRRMGYGLSLTSRQRHVERRLQVLGNSTRH